MKLVQKLVLPAILILGFALRFNQLGSYPALNADEAALGYNAYSLLQTGRDEHGNSWPLHFQSFNDYKPGLTVYLVMPFIALFGLNEWSVRILPAAFGVLTIYAVYLLVKELFKKSFTNQQRSVFALCASFLLAISPWHIHFSRGAWEVNIATCFITFGLLFFLRFISRPRFLFLSALMFILSLYTYHAARIIVPLLGIGLVGLYRRDLWTQRRVVCLVALFTALLCLPLLFSLTGPSGVARAGGVALWADPGPQNRANELRGDYQNVAGLPAKILHNKPIAYSIAFFENWSKHYWGEFLFLSGDDIQRNKVPDTGQLHFIELMFLAVGIIALCRHLTREWGVVVWWLMIAPIPAALTFQAPHALRAQNMIIPVCLVSALGLMHILLWVKRMKAQRVLQPLFAFSLVIVMLWSLGKYTHFYYTHMSKEYPFSSQYGVKELVEYLKPIQNNHESIVITDRYDQPYILFLFYLNYDPAKFQTEHSLEARDQFGFSTVRSFSNFKFEPIDFEKSLTTHYRSLIVGTNEEIPHERSTVKDIYGSNGYKYFRIVSN